MRPARLAGMTGIGVDRMGDLADAAGGADVLRLENLDTDVPPHPAALEATRQAIVDDASNSYLPFVGQTRLRRAVAAHVARLSGAPCDGERNVLISAGGLSGILNVLLALVDTGDEVILTDPTYVGLINRVRLAGGVLTREDWEEVARIVRERELWLIHDTAMQRILFDGRGVVDPAGLPGMAERTITVGSASKELRLIGWRVGWIVAPVPLVPDLALVSMGNVVVPVGIGQTAAAVALEAGDDDVAQATATWQARRDLILRELAGLPVIRPGGGWSLLIDGTGLGLTGAEMSRRLFDRARVAATPMDGWGEVNGARLLRLVFANEPVERLRGIGDKARRAWAR